MPFKSGLHQVDDLDAGEAQAALTQDGWLAFVLDGTQITDRESFFTVVRRIVPLDPPVYRNCVWDALSDSLFGGIDLIEADKVAILWPSSCTI